MTQYSNTQIDAPAVSLARDVVIADDVRIAADRVEIGAGCRIGRGTRIVCPDVRIGEGTIVGAGTRIELNEHLRIGGLCQLGERLRVVGQGFTAGERLWLTDDVVVGGGGARSADAYLTIGARAAIMDRCYINVCRRVTIGDDTALSNNVFVLTHTLWHSALDGGSPTFAPVTIGNDVIVFVNAVVAPGVVIGDHATVAANALVLGEVPAQSVAVGNPARIVRHVPAYPRTLSADQHDAIVRAALREYVPELGVKGLRGALVDPDTLVVHGDGWTETIRYLAHAPAGSFSGDTRVTLSCGTVPPSARAACHFDLRAGRMEGSPTNVSEDLRDFLRRRAMRVVADRPFMPLPPANIARLRARLHE